MTIARVTSCFPAAFTTMARVVFSSKSIFFSVSFLGRPRTFGFFLTCRVRHTVPSERPVDAATSDGVMPCSKCMCLVRAFSSWDMRGARADMAGKIQKERKGEKEESELVAKANSTLPK